MFLAHVYHVSIKKPMRCAPHKRETLIAHIAFQFQAAPFSG
jgi:hypothetical protein